MKKKSLKTWFESHIKRFFLIGYLIIIFWICEGKRNFSGKTTTSFWLTYYKRSFFEIEHVIEVMNKLLKRTNGFFIKLAYRGLHATDYTNKHSMGILNKFIRLCLKILYLKKIGLKKWDFFIVQFFLRLKTYMNIVFLEP